MIERYKNQVDSLAKELGCEVRFVDDLMGGMMFVEFGYVETPHIVDQKTYLIALHECGHFAWNHGQGRPGAADKRFYFDNGVLRSEAQAWNWALDKSIDEPTESSRRFMWDVCLGSYYTNSLRLDGKPTRLLNGNRHHIEFVYDKPDAYFTETVKRIQGELTGFNTPYIHQQ